jgi:hypothetical protein
VRCALEKSGEEGPVERQGRRDPSPVLLFKRAADR